MDQSSYWMWPKSKSSLNPHVVSSFDDSWEEQAFAEDAAGPLGGCVWPPRSYTCSFCRREFRSAQALGGHMNVHRRDRARLKQNSIPIVESSTSLGSCRLQYPTQVCNPNFDFDQALFASASTGPSSVSVLPPFTSSRVQEQQKSIPTPSWPKLGCDKYIVVPDLSKQEKGCSKVLESNSTASKENNHNILSSDLSVNLNLLIRPVCSDKGDTEGLRCKRRRLDDETLSFFPKRSLSADGDQAESKVLYEHSPTSTLEKLDLELRLGDRP